MNTECRKRIRRLAANTSSRKRMFGVPLRSQVAMMQTAEYRAALLRRYPVGLIDDAEIEALLKGWVCSATAYQSLAVSVC